MATVFKLIIFLFSIPLYSFSSSIIDTVVFPNSTNKIIIQQLKNRFEGKPFDQTLINSTILELNKKGTFSSINYKLIKTSKNTTLAFQTTKNPIVKKIIINKNGILLNNLHLGLKTKVGSILNYNTLSEDISYINNFLRLNEYSYSSVKTATINKTGVLIFTLEVPIISEIQFIGIAKTNPNIIYRELLLKEKTIINDHYFEIDYKTLSNLPYFSFVNIPTIEYITSENIIIKYQVKEKKINRLDIGIEELENNQGVAFFSKFTLFHPFIYSDKLILQTQLAYLKKFDIRTYKVRYEQPWFLNRYNYKVGIDAQTVFRSEIQQGNSTIFKTIRSGGGGFIEKSIKNLSLKIGSGIYYEEVSPQDNSNFTPYKLTYWRNFIEKNTIKNHINPKHGSRTLLIIDRGLNIMRLNSNINFSRVRLSHSNYITKSKNLTYAYQLFLGAYDKQASTPTFETEKFSLGGANSLRGFQELSFYGNYRFSLNLEPRYQFNDNLIGVVFLDIGYISDTIKPASLNNNFYYGYGLGIRLLNSLIPLRIDLAYGDDLMVHISVYQTFL